MKITLSCLTLLVVFTCAGIVTAQVVHLQAPNAAKTANGDHVDLAVQSTRVGMYTDAGRRG